MKRLAEAINKAFFKAYPSTVDLFGASQSPEWKELSKEDEDLLIRRVNMLIDDLLCTRQNWHITNEAYCKLDCKHRSIREHWWQFWRSWKRYQCAPMPERRQRNGFRNPERRRK